MTKHFKKVKEDFICENCGEKVKGTGYTNHCPKCLYSKHVDEEVPGDRGSKCLGLMKPIAAEAKSGEYKIFYVCQKCGKRMTNRASKNDSFDEILFLTTKSHK